MELLPALDLVRLTEGSAVSSTFYEGCFLSQSCYEDTMNLLICITGQLDSSSLILASWQESLEGWAAVKTLQAS